MRTLLALTAQSAMPIRHRCNKFFKQNGEINMILKGELNRVEYENDPI